MEQIGEGGFGLVFVAEQQKPVRRKVALKVIKPGMDTREVIARFEAERQALALMDHPNIAKVLDAGATESGRPYFVMEFVRGIAITDFCDQNHLTPRERLELFVTVCQAVQHAHQKGIIHRDIKPSNVLVTLHDGKPVVKVIDFGVAKALHQPLTDKTIYTRVAQVIGTPLYMSPEQAELSGLDIDTRSDIYSLGVLLYELLTGTTPFDRKRIAKAAYAEVIRIIRDEEPPKPSTRLSQSTESLPAIAAQRKTEPARLSKMFRGDLDWITMKALEKDRARRYETASGFAADIVRYLHDEPVEASPPSTAYRLKKLARRHRTALATSAAFVGLLFIAVIASSWLAIANRSLAFRERSARDRADKNAALAAENAKRASAAADNARQAQSVAEQERQKAIRLQKAAEDQRKIAESEKRTAEAEKKRAEENSRQTRLAVDRYFTLISESRLMDVAGAEPLRKELLSAALEYYEKFPKVKSDDAEVQAELAAAYFRMTQIQNTTGGGNWLATFEKGLEIVERLIASKTPIEKLKSLDSGIAEIAGQGFWLDPASYARAVNVVERAVRAWEKLVAARPSSVGFRNDLATMYNVLGVLKGRGGSHAEYLALHSRAREIWKTLAAEHPETPRFRGALAKQNINVASSHLSQQNYAAALAALRDAETLSKALASEHPNVPRYRQELADAYHYMVMAYLQMRHTSDAAGAIRNLLGVREKLVADFPTVTAYKTDLSNAYANQLSLVGTVLPRLVSLRTSFLTVFDLYTELKEKQNALESRQSHGGQLQPAVTVAASAPGGGSFPSLNRHLSNAAFLPLKHLLEKTPKGLRAQLIDTYAERAKSGQRQGAKTYRIAAASLRWWAGQQEAAVKLLQSYAQETPHDPPIVLALVEACRSMTKDAAPRAPKPAELLDILFDSLKNPTIGPADADLIVQSIRQLDPEGKLAGPRWDALLKREEPSVRRLALRGLPDDASQLKRFAPAIEQSLADADAGVRAAAALRAWKLNHQADKAVPILTDCLRDPASENRVAALSALVAIGPSAQAALTSLQPLVDDLDGDIRIAAGLALWRVGHDASAVKRLAAEFQKRERSGDPSWVSELIGVGFEMGPAAQDALPALFETLPLTDSSEERCNEILRAIRSIDPMGTLAVPLLLRLSDGKNASLRSTALTSLNDCAWSLATNVDPKLRDPRRAAELAQIVVKKGPNVAAFWNTLGVALYRTGDWNASLAALSKSMEQTGPNSADGFFVAMAHWQRGEKENARKWYTAASRWAAKYAPTDQEQARFRAEAAALLKTPEALPVEKADDLAIGDAFVEAAGSAFAYHYRAGANADLGRFDRAADDLAKAIQLGDESVSAWYEAALARLGHNDQRGYQTACAALIQRHAQEKQPAMAHLAVWTCVLAPHALDDFKPAIGLATKTLKTDPNSAMFLTGLGAVLYRAGRFDEGLKQLQQAEVATQKSDEDRVLIAYRGFFLAMAHGRLHHSAEAKMSLDKARRTAERAMQLHAAKTQELRWNRRLSLSLLKKEAEELVSKDETPHTASKSAPVSGKK
jgi:serine/threonine protein kinase/tetratricopeptide (TPR) repeat protein